jgi:hypothetical protein
MFPHVNRAGPYEYLRILETYYEKGKHKQRVVADLGRLDRIQEDLPKLLKDLSRFAREPLVAPDDVQAVEALPWGPVLLARHLYEELGLPRILAEQCSSPRRKLDVPETAFVRVRDLFSLNVDLVFYDVTNAYFCRRRPKERLRRHGKPTQGESRNVLVVLGVVVANGWPIAHHVFPGKRTLEHHLREAGLYLSPTEAFNAMHSIGVSVLDFNGHRRLLTTAGSRDARLILRTLGIEPLAPPQPQLAVRETCE